MANTISSKCHVERTLASPPPFPTEIGANTHTGTDTNIGPQLIIHHHGSLIFKHSICIQHKFNKNMIMDENRFYLSHFGTATVLNWCSNFICEWNAISLYHSASQCLHCWHGFDLMHRSWKLLLSNVNCLSFLLFSQWTSIQPLNNRFSECIISR